MKISFEHTDLENGEVVVEHPAVPRINAAVCLTDEEGKILVLGQVVTVVHYPEQDPPINVILK